MKSLFILIIFFFAIVSGGIYFVVNNHGNDSDEQSSEVVERPYLKYAIENLGNTTLGQTRLQINNLINEEDDFKSYIFDLSFDPSLSKGKLSQTSGQINIPVETGKYPLVIMIRGYVDEEIYETGMGTRNAAAYFTQNGFITVAPDFLGYGTSDPNSSNIFESRFQTYTTVLALIDAIEALENYPESSWDGENLFIWAHSNGGQIAITVLETTGKNIPTTLWAPVTAPFPYSILYYTIESDDGGKFIRRELAKFEDIYDTDKFSITKYIDRIQSPIQIHQGLSDDAIPVEWTRDFVDLLEAKDKQVEYFEYPEADHDMRPVWDEVVEKDLKFFRANFIN